MRQDYRAWLEAQGYGGGTVTAQLHRTGRVEDHYGDLERHYRSDGLRSVVDDLRYTTDDERRGRPNPSKIPFDGNPRTNLASYRFAVEKYREFLSGETGGRSSAEDVKPDIEAIASEGEAIEEVLSQRIGLERDLQLSLRQTIEQLEPGLSIVDNGVERIVESGRVDITARDQEGATVVVELKAGVAGQRAVAQVLSYMGDVLVEEPDSKVRGFLVAASFDKKAVAAARMAPTLTLKAYSVRFLFWDP